MTDCSCSKQKQTEVYYFFEYVQFDSRNKEEIEVSLILFHLKPNVMVIISKNGTG